MSFFRCTFGLALLVVSLPAPAQSLPYTKELRGEHLQGAALVPLGATGDLDGDGDVDLLATGKGLRAFLNDGRGRFVDPYGAQLTGLRTLSVALVDADRDGDLDALAAVTARGYVRLLLNDGRGRMTVSPTPLPKLPGLPVGFAVGDFDGDGMTDAMVPTQWALHLWVGGAGGTFRDASSGLPRLFVSSVTLAVADDFDRDGDLDLFVADRGGPLAPRHTLLANDGRGRFRDVSSTSLPRGGPPALSVAVADFDGDGWPDLFLAGYKATNAMWLGGRGGKFRDDSRSFLPTEPKFADQATAAFDADRDGDTDLLVCATTSSVRPLGSNRNRLFLNDRGRRLVPAPAGAEPDSLGATFDALTADLDGDGNTDVLLLDASRPPSLLFSEGDGTLRDGGAKACLAVAHQGRGAALGDMDGDGSLDLVHGSQDYVEVLLQNGQGRFDRRIPAPISRRGNVMRGLALGDVDGDGDLDVAVAMMRLIGLAPDRLLLNDGSGKLTEATATHLRVPPTRSLCAALLDVDGDGDLDLFLGASPTSHLLLNDGRGRFSPAPAGALPARSAAHAVVHGDVDGDGDQDLVVAMTGAQILLNDGRGKFRDFKSATNVGDPITAMDLGDIDGDGDLDLLLGTGAFPVVVARDRLFENLGGARFAELPRARFPGGNVAVNTGVALLDVDGDGDLDVRTQSIPDIGNTPKRFRSLYLNDGQGNFTDASSALPAEVLAFEGLLHGDLDRDGDEDLVRVSDAFEVQAGLGRELHVPFLARPGEDLKIEIWTRAARMPNPIAMLFLAPHKFSRPIAVPPYGWLGVDPFASLVVPPRPIPRDRAVLTLGVPAAGVFSGLPLHLQALLVEGPSIRDVHLTRTVSVRLRR